jgi:NADH pyrophosphatase NudC (nudix superfamily)
MVTKIMPGHKRRKTKVTRKRDSRGVVVSYKKVNYLRKKKKICPYCNSKSYYTMPNRQYQCKKCGGIFSFITHDSLFNKGL